MEGVKWTARARTWSSPARSRKINLTCISFRSGECGNLGHKFYVRALTLTLSTTGLVYALRLNPEQVETLKKNLYYFLSFFRSFEINPEIVFIFS